MWSKEWTTLSAGAQLTLIPRRSQYITTDWRRLIFHIDTLKIREKRLQKDKTWSRRNPDVVKTEKLEIAHDVKDLEKGQIR